MGFGRKVTACGMLRSVWHISRHNTSLDMSVGWPFWSCSASHKFDFMTSDRKHLGLLGLSCIIEIRLWSELLNLKSKNQIHSFSSFVGLSRKSHRLRYRCDGRHRHRTLAVRNPTLYAGTESVFCSSDCAGIARHRLVERFHFPEYQIIQYLLFMHTDADLDGQHVGQLDICVRSETDSYEAAVNMQAVSVYVQRRHWWRRCVWAFERAYP